MCYDSIGCQEGREIRARHTGYLKNESQPKGWPSFLTAPDPVPVESSSSCWRWWILITASSSCIHRKYEPLKRRACRLKKINCLADSGWVLTEYGLCPYLEIGINCFHDGSHTYFLTQRSETCCSTGTNLNRCLSVRHFRSWSNMSVSFTTKLTSLNH